MSNEREPSSEAHVLPSRLLPPTGNLIQDSLQVRPFMPIFQVHLIMTCCLQSARHIGDIPCARNAFLTGIVGGAGMGIIRGLSTSASSILQDNTTWCNSCTGLMGAGHWAMGTCILLSVASWCVGTFSLPKHAPQYLYPCTGISVNIASNRRGLS